MRNLIISILIIYFNTSVDYLQAQKLDNTFIREEIVEVVDSIATINRFDCDAVSIAGIKPVSYKLFEKLSKNATKIELIELVNHDNPAVQCYSLEALGKRESIDIYPILLSQISNSKNVTRACLCLFDRKIKVFDFVFEQIKYFESQRRIILDTQEIERIDSIILYNDYSDFASQIKQYRNRKTEKEDGHLSDIIVNAFYQPSALDEVLLRINPKESYYNRFLEIAEDSISKNAIIPLAKFNKKKDIHLIKSYFPKYHIHHTFLNAIFEFPDTAFLYDLNKLQNQYISRQYRSSCSPSFAYSLCNFYTVLVQYQNQRSIDIINLGLNGLKSKEHLECHLNALCAALEFFPSIKYYDNYKSTIILTPEREKKISSIVQYAKLQYKINKTKR